MFENQKCVNAMLKFIFVLDSNEYKHRKWTKSLRVGRVLSNYIVIKSFAQKILDSDTSNINNLAKQPENDELTSLGSKNF
jgi:hypothetical protein